MVKHNTSLMLFYFNIKEICSVCTVLTKHQSLYLLVCKYCNVFFDLNTIIPYIPIVTRQNKLVFVETLTQ